MMDVSSSLRLGVRPQRIAAITGTDFLNQDGCKI
jgi:hypothetical protein